MDSNQELWFPIGSEAIPVPDPEHISNFVLHYKGLFSNSISFQTFLDEILPLCRSYERKNPYNNTTYETPRMSCLLISDNEINPYRSEDLSSFPFETSQIICAIKNFLETNFLIPERKFFDYCLIHIYRNGDDYIHWHSDREALNSSVFSISFGATRKFRFRKLGQKTGFETEIILENGDLCIMLPGCQNRFEHHISKEKRIKEPRINLTFRCVE